MCLAIPGQVIELEPGGHLAIVEVSKVRRTINIDLLEPPPSPGEWVLIHVGFAMNRISADQAAEQLRLLAMLGEDAQAMAELEGYSFGEGAAGERAEAREPHERSAPAQRRASEGVGESEGRRPSEKEDAQAMAELEGYAFGEQAGDSGD